MSHKHIKNVTTEFSDAVGVGHGPGVCNLDHYHTLGQVTHSVDLATCELVLEEVVWTTDLPVGREILSAGPLPVFSLTALEKSLPETLDPADFHPSFSALVVKGAAQRVTVFGDGINVEIGSLSGSRCLHPAPPGLAFAASENRSRHLCPP